MVPGQTATTAVPQVQPVTGQQLKEVQATEPPSVDYSFLSMILAQFLMGVGSNFVENRRSVTLYCRAEAPCKSRVMRAPATN